jgi:carboxymethylenebutenolidase
MGASSGNGAPRSIADVVAEHIQAEIDVDLDGTMATMATHPHLTVAPTLAGGVGRQGVRDWYEKHFIGRFLPPDGEIVNVSQTVGDTQVVNEDVVRFTHTEELDWILPGVPPTGKPVEIAMVVIVGVVDGKVTHEHIYWDQASLLTQIGLLDPSGLPISPGHAAKILDPSLANREYPSDRP